MEMPGDNAMPNRLTGGSITHSSIRSRSIGTKRGGHNNSGHMAAKRAAMSASARVNNRGRGCIGVGMNRGGRGGSKVTNVPNPKSDITAKNKRRVDNINKTNIAKNSRMLHLKGANLPTELLSEGALTTHFRNFVGFEKVTVNEPTRSATICFDTHVNALIAKSKGTRLASGVLLSLFWSSGPKEKQKLDVFPARNFTTGSAMDINTPTPFQQQYQNMSFGESPPVSNNVAGEQVTFGNTFSSMSSNAPKFGTGPALLFGSKKTDGFDESSTFSIAQSTKPTFGSNVDSNASTFRTAARLMTTPDATEAKSVTTIKNHLSSQLELVRQQRNKCKESSRTSSSTHDTEISARRAALETNNSRKRLAVIEETSRSTLSARKAALETINSRKRLAVIEETATLQQHRRTSGDASSRGIEQQSPSLTDIGEVNNANNFPLRVSQSEKHHESSFLAPMPSTRKPANGSETNNFSNSAVASSLCLDEAINTQRWRILQEQTRIESEEQAVVADVQTQLSNATLLVGTCEDMCPEYERYKRAFSKDLSRFENHSGVETSHSVYEPVNHVRAVKEYSRAAAGMGTRLPSHVRTPATLTTTLRYLSAVILSSESERDNSFIDLYNFVSDRMRAIMTDLTVQNVRDSCAVTILEQVARFHIYAGHRLCDQPEGVFSANLCFKMLNMALTSLMELYDDARQQLPGKRSLIYFSEPEFRAYDILLHRQHVLQTVQSLPLLIRNSQEVQFSIGAMMAHLQNNFIRYIRLISTTTYLNACLMAMQFRHIRRKALEIMTRGYRGGNGYYPLDRFSDILGFDSPKQAADFCTHHGITSFPSTTGHQLQLKSTFVQPDAEYSSAPSLRLVEALRHPQMSIGSVINNTLLPPSNEFPLLVPHSSFGDRGFLSQNDACPISSQEQTIATPIQLQETRLREEQEEKSRLDAAAAESILLREKKHRALAQVAEEKRIQEAADAAAKVKFEEDMRRHAAAEQMKLRIAREAAEAEAEARVRAAALQKAEAAAAAAAAAAENDRRRREEYSASIERSVHSLSDDLLADVVGMQIHQICRTEAEVLIQAQRKYLSELQLEHLVEDILLEEGAIVARDALGIFSTHIGIIRRFVRKWVWCFRRKHATLTAISAVPAVPTVLKPSIRLQRLSGVSVAFSDMSHQRSIAMPLTDTFEDAPLNDELVDLAGIVSESLSHQHRGRQHWKLLVALPVDNDMPTDGATYTTRNMMWLHGALTVGGLDPGASDGLLALCLVPGVAVEVALCVREMKGSVGPVRGTSAMLFVLGQCHVNQSMSDFWYKERLRLNALFQRLVPTPPVVIVHFSLESDDDILLGLGLQNSKATFMKVINCSFAQRGLRLSEAISWLTEHMASPPPLHCGRLADTVENVIVEHVFLPWELLDDRHCLSQTSDGFSSETVPEIMISGFNAVLHRLVVVLTKDNAAEKASFSWPAPELASAHGAISMGLPPVDWISQRGLIHGILRCLEIPTSYKFSSKLCPAEEAILFAQYLVSATSGRQALIADLRRCGESASWGVLMEKIIYFRLYQSLDAVDDIQCVWLGSEEGIDVGDTMEASLNLLECYGGRLNRMTVSMKDMDRKRKRDDSECNDSFIKWQENSDYITPVGIDELLTNMELERNAAAENEDWLRSLLAAPGSSLCESHKASPSTNSTTMKKKRKDSHNVSGALIPWKTLIWRTEDLERSLSDELAARDHLNVQL